MTPPSPGIRISDADRERAAARLQQPGQGDEGMATAEYAVATVAAAGFGGILWKVITSPEVLAIIKSVISRALEVTFGA